MKREHIMAHKNARSIPRLKDRLIEQKELKRVELMLPAMPIRVVYEPRSVITSLQKQGEEINFRFKYEGELSDSEIDAASLRETFLGIRTPAEALDLLTLAGPFRSFTDDDGFREAMRWSDFKRWQEIIRIVVTGGPLQTEEYFMEGQDRSYGPVGQRYRVSEQLRPALTDLSMQEQKWLSGFPDQILIRADEPVKGNARKKVCAEVFVHSILEAILATAYIDGLKGIDYQLCALPDCSQVYEVSSKHERQYCSQACAHKASVRRRRAEAKAASNAVKARMGARKSRKGRN